jgi:hypothetical protein
MKLDVQFRDGHHYFTVPKYVSTGLEKGTIQPRRLDYTSWVVTLGYMGLVISQAVLFVVKAPSSLSAAVWGAATGAGIVAAAWLGGFPLVCSGIV